MRKIRVAQIGIGHDHAAPAIQTLRNMTDRFDLAGIAFPENEKEKFPERAYAYNGVPELTLDQILNDPTIEAVVVEMEDLHQTKYALMAAAHGKQIQMDKPGGRELADFEKLIADVKEKGLVFHLGYMYRYNPEVMELMDRIQKGELGEIISVEAQMNCIHIPEKRQWLATYPGGMMFFLGCHLIDLIYRIQGEPERIIPLNKCTGLDDVTGEDFGMAVLEYKNGVSFAKTSAVEYGGFTRRQLVVTGSKETVQLKPLEAYTTDNGSTLLYTTKRVCREYAWESMGTTTNSQPYDRYETMFESFADIVLGVKENPYTYDYELALYKTLLRACGAL